MSRRSRRKKSTLQTHWLSIVIIAALVVAAAGGVYVVTRGSTTSPATSSTSSISSSGSSTSSNTGTGTGNYAVLDTSQGTIVIELYPQDAPQTVANFKTLANQGFYSNLVWHRIVAGFVIQTGDPNTRNTVNSTRSTWGQGGSGTTIPFENSTLQNNQGWVAMARGSSINSASSQFYINLVNNPSLNGQYAVFGQVVSGMNVVDAIGALPVYTNSNSFSYDQPIDAQNALLISVTIQNSP